MSLVYCDRASLQHFGLIFAKVDEKKKTTREKDGTRCFYIPRNEPWRPVAGFPPGEKKKTDKSLPGGELFKGLLGMLTAAGN